MKKLFLLMTALWVAATTVNAQVLYKISGNGLQEPSYLLGTFHLAQPSFVDSIPGFHQAFSRVGQVYGEVVTAEMKKPETMQKMMAVMLLPDSMTLQSLFTDSEMQKLNALAKELLGAELTHPVMSQSFGRMRPAAVNTTFTVLIYQKFLPEASAQEAIDGYVQTLALQNDKKVGGLESIDDQLAVLFTITPIERQARQLLCMVEHKDYNLEFSRQMIASYYAQDLDQIKQLMDEKLGDDCDNTDEEDEIMITGRNKNWMTQIPTIMAECPTLFAVGAAHLIGDEGLITLLRNEGFQVEPVAAQE